MQNFLQADSGGACPFCFKTRQPSSRKTALLALSQTHCALTDFRVKKFTCIVKTLIVLKSVP